MKWAILFAALTILLMFALRSMPSSYDSAVRARFLEGWPSYTTESLRTWVESHREAARSYVFPVLTLDIVFLLCLGGFLAFGSGGLAQSFGSSKSVIAAVLILPIGYVLIDLAEDLLLMYFLTSPNSISNGAVAFTQAITKLKMFVCGAALLQTAGLAACALWRG